MADNNFPRNTNRVTRARPHHRTSHGRRTRRVPREYFDGTAGEAAMSHVQPRQRTRATGFRQVFDQILGPPPISPFLEGDGGTE